MLRTTYCRLQLCIGGVGAGAVDVQLFDDLVPRTAANFRAFCAGTTAGGEADACEVAPEAVAGGDMVPEAAAVGGEAGSGGAASSSVAVGSSSDSPQQGKLLHYCGSPIHRVVKGFMLQVWNSPCPTLFPVGGEHSPPLPLPFPVGA